MHWSWMMVRITGRCGLSREGRWTVERQGALQSKEPVTKTQVPPTSHINPPNHHSYVLSDYVSYFDNYRFFKVTFSQ